MATEQKYNTIKEYLDHLIAGKETSCVEFKYGKGDSLIRNSGLRIPRSPTQMAELSL